MTATTRVDRDQARAVLEEARRVAVVGAPDERDSFGRTIVREPRRPQPGSRWCPAPAH